MWATLASRKSQRAPMAAAPDNAIEESSSNVRQPGLLALTAPKFIVLVSLSILLTMTLAFCLLGLIEISTDNADFFSQLLVDVPVIFWPSWALVSLLIALTTPELTFYAPDLPRRWTALVAVLSASNFLATVLTLMVMSR